MSEIVCCARAISAGEERRDFAFTVENGRIATCGDPNALAAQFPDARVRRYEDDVAVVPGFINGHSHAYQILLRGWADDLPFERWRTDALYKIVPQLSPDHVYWTFVLAFEEMLAAGITTVAEFFYLNGAGNDYAEAALRAAADTGIRIVLARTWMDADYAPGAFRESIDTAASRTRALMDAHPGVDICVAPHSLHAASHAMIQAAMEFALERDVFVHLHVAEAQYEGAQTLERHGATPIVLLDRLGVLNDRLVAIHAIYLTGEEKRLLAQQGVRVVHNPTTNQYLGDGICDLTQLLALGVRVGLGTDADVKPSILDEMRAASLLQKIAHLDGSALGAGQAFALGTSLGAAALGVSAGDLQTGNYADYAVIDLSRADPWAPLANTLV
ncbi:MAG: amidohydrolase family protein, partial [Candidatus Eremiobacteraeota bacterium]|nr:amidohydrolase family protein [Candidatus Eremiobacteraeota bacterium]